MTDRALTFVDRAEARIANRWLQRAWSAFLGATTTLTDLQSGVEWLVGRGREFQFLLDGREVGPFDCGEAEWSEANSPAAASLTLRKQSPDLHVTIDTVAFHDAPGMLRTLTLRNLADEPVRVARPVIESLALLRDGVEARIDSFAQRRQAVEWRTTERAAALCGPAGGLFIGIEGGGRFEIFAPDPTRCTLVLEQERRLDSGEAWVLPSSLLVPFAGPVEQASANTLGPFLVQVRAWRRAAGSHGT